MEIRYIDVQGDWSLEKVARLGSEILREYGYVDGGIGLYLSPDSFAEIQKEFEGIPQYGSYPWSSPGFTVYRVFSPLGEMNVSPTPENDHILLTIGKRNYRFNITDKIKPYKKDFEDLVNS